MIHFPEELLIPLFRFSGIADVQWITAIVPYLYLQMLHCTEKTQKTPLIQNESFKDFKYLETESEMMSDNNSVFTKS